MVVTSPEQSIYTTLGAVCIVLSALGLVKFKELLSNRLMSQLGKYTYSLYLVHQPLIYTVGTGVFMALITHFGYNKSVAMAFIVTIPVVALVTLLFYKFIEQPSIRLASYAQEVFFGTRELLLKQKYNNTKEAIVSIIQRPRRVEANQDPEME